MRRLLGTFLMLALAPEGARAFPITYVEANSKLDCAGTTPGRLASFGGSDGLNDADFDGDGRVEGTPVSATDEDDDLDRVFETIQAAVDATDTDGIVYVLPGVYHENVTVADSVTIRGIHRDTVILDASCLATRGNGIEVTATGKTVAVENLTIIGYAKGIVSDDSALRVRNVVVEWSTSIGIECVDAELHVADSRVQRSADIGIWAPGSGHRAYITDTVIEHCVGPGITGDQGAWHISGCTIRNCTRGIDLSTAAGTNVLSVDDSRILDNVNDGVRFTTTGSSCQLTVSRSAVIGNGAHGITYNGRNSGTVRIADTLVEANGSDGISITNNTGCVTLGTASLKGFVRNSRILGNVGDGIETSGSGSSCFPQGPSTAELSVMGNTIAFNGGYALRTTNGGSTTCSLGQNQFTHNLGVENHVTPECDTSGTSVNQVP